MSIPIDPELVIDRLTKEIGRLMRENVELSVALEQVCRDNEKLLTRGESPHEQEEAQETRNRVHE